MHYGTRSAAVISAAVIAGLVIGSLATSIYLSYGRNPPPSAAVDTVDHDQKMARCIASTIEKAKLPQLNMGVYERIWRLCGNQVFNSLYLTDYAIRKEKFIRQELDERVNLWMVVAITISGVLLSGVQLFLSYRLAEQGKSEFAKDSELAIQNSRISLRSSVTGTIILAISLAFFMVYVHWIYSIHEVSFSRPANLETPTEVNLDGGAERVQRPPESSVRRPGSDRVE